MKNFIIGVMLGVWLGPIGKEVAHQMVVKSNARRESEMNELADTLKALVEEKRFVDVSRGAEIPLGVSQLKLQKALSDLEKEGYNIHRVRLTQKNSPGNYVSVKVLTKGDVTWEAAWQAAGSGMVQ